MKNIHTISLPGFHPLCFFQKLGLDERRPAFFTSDRWTILAWNPIKTIVGDDLSALQDLKKSMSKRRHASGTNLPFVGGALGYVSYSATLRSLGMSSQHQKIFCGPDVVAHVYDSALLFDGEKVVVVGTAKFVQSVLAIHVRPYVAPVADFLAWSPSMTKTEYAQAFRRIKKGILQGDFYQLNLSYQLQSNIGASPKSLFTRFAYHNPASAMAYIEYEDSAILSMSPERFVTIDRSTIRTEPIKGTRSRGRKDAEDKRLKEDLLKDPKESAELSMIVDLLRNDIGKVSAPGSVRVSGHRLLQKNSSVWHTYSVIEGTLAPSLHPLDAYTSMLPGGSVTGCPKISAIEEIDRRENTARGPYCGSLFLLSDAGFFDSSILIRTVAQSGKRLAFGVGGGIVHDSILQREFDETLQKAERIFTLPSQRTWINGKEVFDDPRLRFLDPSHRLSHGVFETMRSDGGRIDDLSAHLDRLERSADILTLKLPISRQRILAMMRSCLQSLRRTSALRWKIVCTETDVIIECAPLVLDPSHVFGVSATVTHLDRRVPLAKALPYHRERKAHTDAMKQGFAEAILVKKDGTITEGAYSNIFWVIDGILHTKKDGVLPGITRAKVLRLAKKFGIEFSFAEITPTQLCRADEVFMTKSLTGITPITQIDAKKIGKGEVGRVTERMLRALSPSLAPLVPPLSHR